MRAPFVPSFLPATFSPSHAPNNFPTITSSCRLSGGIRRAEGGECSQPLLGIRHQLLVGKISQLSPATAIFRSFPGLARSLIRKWHRPAEQKAGQKGRIEMSSQSSFTRTLVAIAAALVMSTVAIGAAVGPAQANANTFNSLQV